MLFQPDSDERENEDKVKGRGEGCANTKWEDPESGRNGSEGQCHWTWVRPALWEGLSKDLVFYPKGTEEHWRILYLKRIRDQG